MSGAADERDRIRAAMNRILTGRPERSNGALTIEADVPATLSPSATST